MQDFGIGIPVREQAKIFDILYRAKNKGAIPGTGLGLYISAQILAAHESHLSVESEEGKGSTFTFSLPIARWSGADSIKFTEMTGYIFPEMVYFDIWTNPL